jgi:hypothetical protein
MCCSWRRLQNSTGLSCTWISKACAVHEFIYKAEACAALGFVCTAEACVAPRGVYTTVKGSELHLDMTGHQKPRVADPH